MQTGHICLQNFRLGWCFPKICVSQLRSAERRVVPKGKPVKLMEAGIGTTAKNNILRSTPIIKKALQ